MTIEITVLVGLVCAVLGAFFNFRGSRRSDDVILQKRSEEQGVILTEIGYIKSGIDDIKKIQSKQDEKVIALDNRVTAVEVSSKQLY